MTALPLHGTGKEHNPVFHIYEMVLF